MQITNPNIASNMSSNHGNMFSDSLNVLISDIFIHICICKYINWVLDNVIEIGQPQKQSSLDMNST